MNPFAQRKEVTMNDTTATTATAERVWKKYRPRMGVSIKDERGKSLHLVYVDDDTPIKDSKHEHFFLPQKLCTYDAFAEYDRYDRVYRAGDLSAVTLPDNFEIRLWNKVDGERTVNPARMVELGILEPYSEDDYANEEKAKERARAKRSSRREHTPEPLEPVASVEIPEELRR